MCGQSAAQPVTSCQEHHLGGCQAPTGQRPAPAAAACIEFCLGFPSNRCPVFLKRLEGALVLKERDESHVLKLDRLRQPYVRFEKERMEMPRDQIRGPVRAVIRDFAGPRRLS